MNSMRARSAVAALCLPILIAACSGGGGDSATSSAMNNSASGTLLVKGTFGALPSPLAAVAPGDGIWNYSVATDYYFGSTKGGIAPSLVADFKANNLAQKITYAFPVFGYIDQRPDPTKYYPNTAQVICPDFAGTYTQTVFSYYALPQIKPIITSTPATVLGTCVDGAKVTDYYKNTVGIQRVVPVIEMSAAFNAAIVYQQTKSLIYQFGSDELIQLANNIATAILNDPNAYGVAFDNEPALFKAASVDPNNPLVNCKGLDLEHLFYGALAHALASDKTKGPKYLFLFDAPDTARALYTGASSVQYSDKKGGPYTCPYSATPTTQPAFPPLTNIVMKPALYDLETASDSGPLALATYQTDVNSAVNSALSIAGDPPVMMVLPASATDTMWTTLQTYNLNFSTGSNQAFRNLKAASCDTAVQTPGTPNFIAVTSIICQGDNVQCPNPTSPDPALNLKNAQTFYGNCSAYTNTSNGSNVVMNDYFNVGLSAVNKTNITSKNNARFLGVSLYAWRIEETSDIMGAINYYSIYGDKTLWKVSPQVMPKNILPDAWSSFINWYSSTRPTK